MPESSTRMARYQNEQPEPEPDFEPPRRRHHHLRNLFLLIILGIVIIAGMFIHGALSKAKTASNEMYKSAKINKARDVEQLVKAGKPISILLMGTDTGELGRTDTGRSDTMILATLNPSTNKMVMMSVPRDTKVTIPGYEQNAPSKLNSAYEYGGVGTSMKTVQQIFNVPVDFYVLVNMGGLEKMVDAVGGIDITPVMTFNYEGGSFVKNKKQHVNGAWALKYSRMRYDDPLGDYGRQQRQRQVIMAIMSKAKSLNVLMNDTFLKSVSSQIRTDFTYKDELLLASRYKKATNNVESDHAQGTSQMLYGEAFEVLNYAERTRVTNKLRGQLNLDPASTGTT